uniref:Secreted protein n=1 Tax=Globodera rostochiensis TaxID=31243 RepID=A0A914HRD3_GLORO
MRFCVLVLVIFVLFMAISGAECGCFGSKRAHTTAGSGQSTQRQQGTQLIPMPLPVPVPAGLSSSNKTAESPGPHSLPNPLKGKGKKRRIDFMNGDAFSII